MKPTGGGLSRDITVAVACKIVALILIYAILFSPANRLPADTGAHLFDVNPSDKGGH